MSTVKGRAEAQAAKQFPGDVEIDLAMRQEIVTGYLAGHYSETIRVLEDAIDGQAGGGWVSVEMLRSWVDRLKAERDSR